MKKLITLLSSKEFFIWLIGIWIFYYIISATYGKEVLASFLVSLGSNPVLIFLYLVFLISFFLRIIKGLQGQINKGILYTICGFLLPVGIFLVLVYILIHANTSDREKILAAEGEVIVPASLEFPLTVHKIETNIKERFLDIEGDGGIFLEREPTIILIVDGKKKRVGAYPPGYIKGKFIHMLDFGIAPRISIIADGQKVAEGPIAVRLLPPGREDFFEIPDLPYRFYLKLHPNEVIQKGNIKGRAYNLSSPLYFIRITKGEKVLFEGISDSNISFENHSLSLSGYTRWIYFDIVKDPAMPLFLTGLLMVVAGIPARVVLFIGRLFRRF